MKAESKEIIALKYFHEWKIEKRLEIKHLESFACVLTVVVIISKNVKITSDIFGL